MRKCRKCEKECAYLHGQRLCREHFNEYHRIYKENNKERVLKQHRDSRKKTRSDWRVRVRDAANQSVKSALRSGRLQKKECKRCGTGKTQAHHNSYLLADWLKVTWLCREHHDDWHRKYKAKMPIASTVY